MRTLVAALLMFALAGCGGSSQSTSSTSPPPADAASPAASATPAFASDTAAPMESASPAESASPTDAASPSESAASAETASPTPAPEPTGLLPGWADPYQRVVGGPEGSLVVRAGDINNLGFGWPKGFTPFSGMSTPAHAWPCSPRPGAVPGTDRIMLGSVVTDADIAKGGGDGYSHCSTRSETMPEAITVQIGALPAVVHDVFLQMFLDDFQAPSWKSQFQVSLNDTRITSFETTINTMDQTGPVGKLVTLRLLPEYWPLLRTGTLKVSIDDPTTHKLDGYAVDFVRVLVDAHFKYVVSVSCLVLDDATSKPISGASVAAAQMTATTGHDGTCAMKGIPAGIVSVSAGAIGYDSQTQLLDLAAGQHGDVTFRLKRHRETTLGLRAQIARTGTVAIYGIHFDTASARLRSDSIASLDEVLGLVNGDQTARWSIAGHTDNQGGAAYNLALSDARAKSVVAWLVKHGVAANRLVAAGYGLTRPIADNTTASGRALNRRVEVGVVK